MMSTATVYYYYYYYYAILTYLPSHPSVPCRDHLIHPKAARHP